MCYSCVIEKATNGKEVIFLQSKRIHPPYNKFKIWLKDNNITYPVIAELLGITATSVMNKINGKSDFLLSETQRIKSQYHLTDDIFSTEKVA